MGNHPTFSDAAKQAKPVLYTGYNDVTFYVEDEQKEYLYVEIFSRLFSGDNIKLRRVFALGGKTKTLAAFQDWKNGLLSVPGYCFFVVDRDLDPYVGVQFILDDHLIYLEEYCLENYLVDELALLKTLQWKLHKDPANLQTIVEFGYWLSRTLDDFFRLFVAFVLCRKESLGENAGLSPYQFLENNGHRVDGTKVQRYIDDLRLAYCSKKGKTAAEFETDLDDLTNSIRADTQGNPKVVVSGKFLLASLHRYVTHLCQERVDYKLFVGFLVQNFSVESLGFLRLRVVDSIPKGA